MEWSNETALAFIELYENLPVLWDPKHPEHKNRVRLQEAWVELQKGFDESISISDLKKKKESLMASYRPLKRKVFESEKSGYAFKPTWFAYEAIDRFMTYKGEKKPCIIPEQDSWTTETQDDEEPNIADVIPEEEYVIATHESAPAEPKSFARPAPPQKRRWDAASPHDVYLTTSLKKACKALSALSSRQPQAQDQCSIFGQLVAEQLRQLNPKNRILTQSQLNGVLGQALLDELEHAEDQAYYAAAAAGAPEKPAPAGDAQRPPAGNTTNLDTFYSQYTPHDDV